MAKFDVDLSGEGAKARIRLTTNVNQRSDPT
jgi:hypothetical protein